MITYDIAELYRIATDSLGSSEGDWEQEEYSNAIVIAGTKGQGSDGQQLAIAEQVYLTADREHILAFQPKVAVALLQRLSYLEQMLEAEVSHTLPKFRGDKPQYQVMDEVAHFTEEEN